MKTIFTLLFILFSFAGFSQTLLNDNFSTYTVNAELNGQNSWTNNSSGIGGGGSCSGILCTNLGVVSRNITYPAFTSATQAVRLLPDQDAPGKGFTATGAGSVYVFLLVNLSDATTSGGDLFRLLAGSNFSTASRIQVKKVAGGFNAGVDKSGTSVAFNGNIYAFNTDHLFVLKYTFNSGGTNNDQVLLYVDPDLSVAENTSNAILSVAGGSDVAVLDRFMLPYNNTTRPSGYLGAVKVATAWKDDPCAAPTGLPATNITATAARLNWAYSGTTPVEFKLRYRAVGNTAWTVTKAAADKRFKNIKDLAANTKYEWQIKTVCSISSPWAKGPRFKTATGLTSDASGALNAGVATGNSNLQILPTANNGNFVLKINLPAAMMQTNITIYNSTGVAVWQQNVVAGGATSKNIYLENKLANGMYSLVVKRSDASFTAKMMIAR